MALSASLVKSGGAISLIPLTPASLRNVRACRRNGSPLTAHLTSYTGINASLGHSRDVLSSRAWRMSWTESTSLTVVAAISSLSFKYASTRVA